MTNSPISIQNSHFVECEEISAQEADELASQLKALAHPVRLQILQHLGQWSEGCCNDFCACIPLAQSTISQHLKILSNAGFIEYKSQGNCSRYSLKPHVLNDVLQSLDKVRQQAVKPTHNN